jgi:hypothetical protein
MFIFAYILVLTDICSIYITGSSPCSILLDKLFIGHHVPLE